MMASKNHRKVAVVERFDDVGGGCTHWGTIPSKALRHAVKTLQDARNNPFLRHCASQVKVTFPQLLSTADQVIESQVRMRQRFYDRNGVPVFRGQASFVDAHRITVTPRTDAPYQLTADHVVIATGSRPYRPPGLDFSHPRVRDSDTVLQCDETPFAV